MLKIRKLIVCFCLGLYLLLATGLNTYAVCTILEHKTCSMPSGMECSCCHSKKAFNSSGNSITSPGISAECNCIKLPSIPEPNYSFISQYNIDFEKPYTVFETTTDLLFCQDILKPKIIPKTEFNTDINLDILRTIRLLT
jgi:hypothetical protein